MKIDNQTTSLAQAIAQTSVGASALAKTNSQRRSSGDMVRISDMASLLSSDPQKLAQLTAAVQNGTYNVSPSQIANSIINELMLS